MRQHRRRPAVCMCVCGGVQCEGCPSVHRGVCSGDAETATEMTDVSERAEMGLMERDELELRWSENRGL